ncbi:hypothetical protein BV898_09921 [Hypsibius exemplaris]|uniref:Uncharacterized protein n=1 Tax=Hypsibius exemplaris TaxID=2072580 RepID=A0A1W0WLA1_HYPEX|nr:hypothetical protein BV898_09921 [Hypsibius exemplaris]
MEDSLEITVHPSESHLFTENLAPPLLTVMAAAVVDDPSVSLSIGPRHRRASTASQPLPPWGKTSQKTSAARVSYQRSVAVRFPRQRTVPPTVSSNSGMTAHSRVAQPRPPNFRPCIRLKFCAAFRRNGLLAGVALQRRPEEVIGDCCRRHPSPVFPDPSEAGPLQPPAFITSILVTLSQCMIRRDDISASHIGELESPDDLTSLAHMGEAPKHLEIVLRARKCRLETEKPSKTAWGMTSVKFSVTGQPRRFVSRPGRVRAVEQYTTPTIECRPDFLGKVSYYRRLILGIFGYAKGLSILTEKDRPIPLGIRKGRSLPEPKENDGSLIPSSSTSIQIWTGTDLITRLPVDDDVSFLMLAAMGSAVQKEEDSPERTGNPMIETAVPQNKQPLRLSGEILRFIIDPTRKRRRDEWTRVRGLGSS